MKVNNRYLRAAIKTILLGASFHLILLAVYAIVNQDLSVLNIFNILDLDLFFPELTQGALSFFLSYATLGGVFLYFISLEKDTK